MELELKDYFRIIAKRWWFVAIAIAVCCIPVALHERYMTKPTYEAGTKLIVTNTSRSANQAGLDQNEITSNIMIINTYKEIIKSPAIMDKVTSENPEIKRSTKDLIDNVKVTASTNSQVMSITIQDSSQRQAVLIVNAVSGIFKREIPKIMNVDNVTILSEAKLSEHPQPVPSNLLMKLIVFFMVACILSISLIFLREYWDDSIKSEEDVRKYLNMPTLAMVARTTRSEWKGTPEAQKGKVGIESIQHGVGH